LSKKYVIIFQDILSWQIGTLMEPVLAWIGHYRHQK